MLIAHAGQDGGNGEGVVQRRSLGDAEDITFQSPPLALFIP